MVRNYSCPQRKDGVLQPLAIESTFYKSPKSFPRHNCRAMIYQIHFTSQSIEMIVYEKTRNL